MPCPRRLNHLVNGFLAVRNFLHRIRRQRVAATHCNNFVYSNAWLGQWTLHCGLRRSFQAVYGRKSVKEI